MKKLLILALFVILAANVFAATNELCSTNCPAKDTALFYTSSIFGGDNSIKSADDILAHNTYTWTTDKVTDFSLSYDATSGIVLYKIGDNVQTMDYGKLKGMNRMALEGRTSTYGGNSLEFTQLAFNGQSIPDFIVSKDVKGTQITFNDQSFILEGKVLMHVDANSNNEIPGVSILLFKDESSGHHGGSNGTFNTNSVEIPEFGVLAGLIALIGAAAVFVYIRKN